MNDTPTDATKQTAEKYEKRTRDTRTEWNRTRAARALVFEIVPTDFAPDELFHLFCVCVFNSFTPKIDRSMSNFSAASPEILYHTV